MWVLPVAFGQSATIAFLDSVIMGKNLTCLATRNTIMDTMRYAVAMYSHTSSDRGCMKENNSGGSLTALLYRILIPENMQHTYTYHTAIVNFCNIMFLALDLPYL